MSPESIEAGLAALERLRGSIDDEVLDLALTPLLERLAQLRGQAAGHTDGQRLGVVTVMFVDVVGSTALGGKLDPEDIHLVMDPALARFTDIVRRCHGRALQYAGDSMLAAFGTEGAREDDAELAVVAGLAIVREAQVLADRVRRQHNHPGFNVRVGLHTGPVLLGGGVDADKSIRGATVNLAARMEQNTQPGTLRISEDTHRAVQGLFDMDEQPPLRVKGYDLPQRTWLVQRRRTLSDAQARRGVAGVATPVVGRAREWAQLQLAWERLHDGSPQVQTVCVCSEAGLGKTRLVQSWANATRETGRASRWLFARAQARSQSLPFAVLRQLIDSALQLPDDEPQRAREQWVVAVRPLLMTDRDDAGATADAQVMGHLLGLDFSESPALRGILQQATQIRQRGLQAAADVLAAVGQHGALPLAVTLEDAHWADTGTLDFLRGLAQHPSATDLRLLLLLLARPELDERAPSWTDGAADCIQLVPLSSDASIELADALLAPLETPSPALRALLVERAGGNPFYLEELLQMLLAQGVIGISSTSPLRWQLRGTLPDAQALPTSLNGVLQARLQALPADDRAALQQAAVLGLVFQQRTLAEVAPDAAQRVESLADRGLLQARAVALDGDEATYAFSHPFLQQVAYGQLLRRQRKGLHALAARWYAEQTHARAADDWPLAAEHFAQADEPREARRYRLMAAEHFAQRFAHEAVQEQATEALALTPAEDTATRWQLLLLRQRARRQSGQREAQAADLDALADLAELTADPVHAATVAVRRAVAADEAGQSKVAATLAPLALEAAQRAQDSALELLAYGVVCSALRSVGRHEEARRAGEAGLARAKAVGDPTLEADMLVALAAIAAEQSDPLTSTALLRRALYLQQSNGNRFGECISRVNLGTTAQQLGDLATAEREYDEAVRLARHLGNPSIEVMSRLNRASVQLPLGEVNPAWEDAEAAVALAERIGNTEYEAFARMTRGTVSLAQAQQTTPATPEPWARAMADWARSAELLEGLELPHLAIEAVAWQARGHWVRGDLDAAMGCVEQVLAHVAKAGHLDGTENPLQIQSTCIEVLNARNDSRAEPLLNQAWAALRARCQELPDEEARARFMQSMPCCAELQARARAAGWLAG